MLALKFNSKFKSFCKDASKSQWNHRNITNNKSLLLCSLTVREGKEKGPTEVVNLSLFHPWQHRNNVFEEGQTSFEINWRSVSHYRAEKWLGLIHYLLHFHLCPIILSGESITQIARAWKVTVPIKNYQFRKFMKITRCSWKKLNVPTCFLAGIILEQKSVQILPQYLRFVHKLGKIKQAEYYPQRSILNGTSGHCGRSRKRFSSLGAVRSNGLTWRVETEKVTLRQYKKPSLSQS